MALSRIAGVHDAAVGDLDPRTQLVGEPEPIRHTHRLEVVDVVGEWVVVVAESEIDRDTERTRHGLGWDPRDGRDR